MSEEPTLHINNNGTRYWKLNGLYHNTNGPAIVYEDGTKYWFVNGYAHREDGPAVEWKNGKQWWIDGKQISEWEFLEYQKKKQFEKEMSQESDKIFNDDFLSGI